jgi:molybdopterin-containing oxidoreductase family molybdopterin binding subunit
VDARVPFYFERLEREREAIRKNAEKIGFRLSWDHYTALVSYFPPVIYTELPLHSEYDLLLISYRDPLMTHRFTAGEPFINEVAEQNPFSYNIAMNTQTARQKGINDGDTICLENYWGNKISGKVKVTELIHPKVVAAVGLGSWAKGRPISRGKGVNPNALIKPDQYHMCPITGSVEPTVRVKAYTVE